MKNILSTLLLFLAFSASSQDVLPLVDFNGFFKNFQDGFFRQVEFQRIKNFKTGDNVCAYIDFRGNLRVYDGKMPVNVTVVETAEYTVSDFLMTWKIGETLNLWDEGEMQTLSYQTGQYWVSDSLVVFQNLRFNTLNAYYDGRIYELGSWLGNEPLVPDNVGENIIAFKDNTGFFKIFSKGEIYDLDVSDMSLPFTFSGGTNMMAFNDLVNGSFAVFEKGLLLDVEMYNVGEYKTGFDFVAYENLNGDLLMYKNEKTITLSNFRANYWAVRDHVVLWEENSFMYTYYNDQKVEVARYSPEDYKIKNGVIAFRNIMGGVSAFIDGKVHEITNQMDSEYTIHGNSVLVELFNKSYIVFQDGRKFTL